MMCLSLNIQKCHPVAMRSEMKLLKLVLALGLCAGALSACDSIRKVAGLNKKSPDEFAVTTKAPLVIPPDFNLRPPMPGAVSSSPGSTHSSRRWAMRACRRCSSPCSSR